MTFLWVLQTNDGFGVRRLESLARFSRWTWANPSTYLTFRFISSVMEIMIKLFLRIVGRGNEIFSMKAVLNKSSPI